MTTISFIGNLTKDAEVKHTAEGRKYLLLQVAENIRKKDESGNYVKDAEGHYISSQTLYHSVFVNKGEVVLQALDLKKGHAVKVFGMGRFAVEKNAEGYDCYMLKHIVAQYIDINPFEQGDDELASESELATSEFAA